MVKDIQDSRHEEPSFLLHERDMLEAWLEFHRTTLLLKCEGLDDDRRKARPVVSSKLSLHGLVRHMAEVSAIGFAVCCCPSPAHRQSGPTPPSKTASSCLSTTPAGMTTWPLGKLSVRRAAKQPNLANWKTLVYAVGNPARLDGSTRT